jgi:hypothetical protein
VEWSGTVSYILGIAGDGQGLLDVEDVGAEVEHPEALLLLEEVHQGDAAPHESVTELLLTRHAALLRGKTEHLNTRERERERRGDE